MSVFDVTACSAHAMEHFRLRKYRGPEVWRRVREAYVAGESGPSLARRFDVGLANLRKKASREGWTRSAAAAEIDRGLPEIVAAEAAAAGRRERLFHPLMMASRSPGRSVSSGTRISRRAARASDS